MVDAAHQPVRQTEPTSPRRRAIGLLLTVAVHLLLLLLLLRLAPPVIFGPGASPLKTFNLPAEREQAVGRRTAKASRRRAAASAAPRPAATVPPPPIPPKPTPPEHWVLNPELQNFNLAEVPRASSGQQQAQGTADAGAAAGEGAGSSETVGTAPGGGKLFAAEWYREPTNAELGTYLPATRTVGWGEVACRTVARFRVEDCQELGQSPPGSGLSRAVREASFQFLVRPPRVNGRTLVGSWVRIHIDFSERSVR